MPFCPKCRSEYKEGFTVCADCKVELVDFLKEENEYISEDQAQALAYQTLAEELDLGSEEQSTPTPVHAYVNKKDKAEDFKSSAYTLIFVGIIGLICLVLMELHIIPVTLYAPGKYVTYGVMGALFIIFIAAGINSFISSKKYSSEADEEDSNTKAILDYVYQNLTKEKIIEMAGINESLPEEMKYFKYIEVIKKTIINQFGPQDFSFLEMICDEIYGKIFE